MAEVFYVMGASGVGKDSLLGFAQAHRPRNAPVIFAHRYITRPAHAGGENHIALSEDEFHYRDQMGCFAMRWHSHDTWYGVGIEIDQWLAKGLKVVVNGSRGYLNQAVTMYPHLIPILISAAPDRLRERLMARGRETGSEIEARLLRAQSLDREIDHPKLVRINNDGELADAGNRLLELILGEYPQPCG